MKPRLVIVSDTVRRDLHEPLRHFRRFEVFHCYRQASYGDMTEAELDDARLIRWQTMPELWRTLVRLEPSILQGAEPCANRASFLISLVTWWYRRRHPATLLIWPALENRLFATKFRGPKGWLIGWWTGVYGRGAELVVYLNDGARRNLLASGIPESKLERLLWGTWGVDTKEFHPISQISHRKSKIPIVLFVGRIGRAKGFPWLLAALAALQAERVPFAFRLGGPVEDQTLAHAATALGGEALGVIKNRDLPALFATSDIVVTPSITTPDWEEQVGMVSLQAMAAGVPVISTRSGAIPEFLVDGQGAILVPEQDSEQLAAALRKLLTFPTRRRTLGKLARQFVLDRYDVRTNIARVETRLSELLAARAHKPRPSPERPGAN